MRCVIARFPFDLIKSEVQESMKGIKPEPITGESVIIGRRHYPVKQVGEIITRQDRRDFTAGEVTRALTRLGFTCTLLRPPPPAPRSRRRRPCSRLRQRLTVNRRADRATPDSECGLRPPRSEPTPLFRRTGAGAGAQWSE